jgi:hypothetical protein
MINNATSKREEIPKQMEGGVNLSEEEEELDLVDDLIQDGDEHIRKITFL